MVVPEACVIAPAVLLISNVPVIARFPTDVPPDVSVMLAFPPTVTVPDVPCVNPEVTVSAPLAASAPPVWASEPRLTAPADDKVPPPCVKPAKLIPPDPMARLPAVIVSEPRLPTEVRLTVLVSANPVAALVSNTTSTPDGITTDATLAKSGTAPSQLAGSNQFRLPPLPVQVTEANCVIAAEAVPDELLTL